MTLPALQHLIRSAQALAEDCHILVLGSASLLASYPELGSSDGPLASTYDADLCPEPFDELTGTMLEEALGEDKAYFLRHGYHADILRDSILETLPEGWRERLIAVPGIATAHALSPGDLAAVKIFVGRPKDLSLVTLLHKKQLITPAQVRPLLDAIRKPDAAIIYCSRNFRQVFE